MAVVCTIVCSEGVLVNIHDDEYAGLSEEKMNRIQREIVRLAEKILVDAEVRRLNDGEELTKP